MIVELVGYELTEDEPIDEAVDLERIPRKGEYINFIEQDDPTQNIGYPDIDFIRKFKVREVIHVVNQFLQPPKQEGQRRAAVLLVEPV